MRWSDFPMWGRRVADWALSYHQTLRSRPVRPNIIPGSIRDALPKDAPEQADSIEAIMQDFERLVVPGLTHWQHPRFFAYFPANAAPASVLAEYLVSTIAPQCMLWQTSPAATEMETRMLDWLRGAIGLPDAFSGVIQDSASSATLAAVLTMRERALGWTGNSQGLTDKPALRVYCSSEVHTSIDRAIWIAGIGSENLVRIPIVGPGRAMDPQALEAAIRADQQAGHIPIGVIASTGGTSVGGSDDIGAVCKIAKAFDLYVHVDAAWAGSAMICPEYRSLWTGVEDADSVVFNPHKWLGAQFDCAAHFLKNPESLVQTLAIQPEFLKTHGADGIINYSEWSVPLGRRFRALKIWFLLRAYGLEGLRTMIRNHVTWTHEIAERFRERRDFEIVTEPVLALFSFRHVPSDIEDVDAYNLRLVNALNEDGRIYLTQTRVDGKVAIRFTVGAFSTEQEDVQTAYDVIVEIAESLARSTE